MLTCKSFRYYPESWYVLGHNCFCGPFAEQQAARDFVSLAIYSKPWLFKHGNVEIIRGRDIEARRETERLNVQRFAASPSIDLPE